VPSAQAERAAAVRDGLARLAAERGLEVVPDEGLLAEVAGLVEWPVPLLGRIDDAFMDLPAEVMRTSMRVNQRYFALRHPDGRPAPFFGLVANIAASGGGAALVAGNERVLRARLSDARFFWDQDRKTKLEDFLPKLDGAVFHAKLGSQWQRVERIERLARFLAPMVGADPDDAALAARLCKADLASGMVGEFPELQGVMGGHCARAQGLKPEIADAIAQHYRPLGPTDEVPREPVAVAVALADKLDQLVGFFVVGEAPSGSGDPYALRRSGLGVIRTLRASGIRLPLRQALRASFGELIVTITENNRALDEEARKKYEKDTGKRVPTDDEITITIHDDRALTAPVLDFLTERLRVQLRAEGARHDVVAASIGQDDDLLRILARADALKTLVESETGQNLLAAYKRAQNILRIEGKKDGTDFAEPPDPALYDAPAETALAAALDTAEPAARDALAREDFPAATAALAALRTPLDRFFDKVVVNDPQPQRRLNRLRLLSRLRSAFDTVADLSKIEG
jgi:glycyl-tRNA synthetase beta chain